MQLRYWEMVGASGGGEERRAAAKCKGAHGE